MCSLLIPLKWIYSIRNKQNIFLFNLLGYSDYFIFDKKYFEN